MQKLANFLKKFNTPLAYAIFLILVGVAFIAVPKDVIYIVMMSGGGIIALVALIRIIVAFLEFDRTGPCTISFSVIKNGGIIMFGAVIMALAPWIPNILCRLIGFSLAGLAIFRLIKLAFVRRKRVLFWIETVLTLLFFAFGIVLLVYPYLPTPEIMSGISLIGIASKIIYDLIRKAHRKRKKKEEEDSGVVVQYGVYYSMNYVDKTEGDGSTHS